MQDLIEDPNLCTEVHKFSKFIHGTCTLFPHETRVRRCHTALCDFASDFMTVVQMLGPITATREQD